MRGVANIRPSIPRYTSTWDVSFVLNFFRKQPLVSNLSLVDLTMRTVTLLALVTAVRCHTIYLLDIDHMTTLKDMYIFHVYGNFKQSRPNNDYLSIELPVYDADCRICIYRTMTEYLKRTRPIRSSSRLFVATVTPHNAVCTSTISRWIKVIMTMSGVDVSIFKPHSVRSASSSAAKRGGAVIHEILQKAGWSNEKTFSKFYNRPVIDRSAYARSVIQSH